MAKINSCLTRTATATFVPHARSVGVIRYEEMKHPIPEWVTRGKTIKQLIEELQSFENQDMEVRLSLDDGDTHLCVSMVETGDGKYCVLKNSESYHENEWQDFMEADDDSV